MKTIVFEGMEHSFPDDATDDEIRAVLEQMHPAPAPRASQASVRASEPVSARERQSNAERQFAAARDAWMQATGGRLKPGQDERQAVAEFSGLQDPRETSEQAMVETIGEEKVVPESDSVGYGAAKLLAGGAGFMTGGPAGATGMQGLVDVAVIVGNLDKAVKAGHITQDEAAEIGLRELGKRVGTDAVMNYGLPLLAKGMGALMPQWLKDKAGSLAQKGIAKATEGLPKAPAAAPAASPEVARRAEELAALTTNPQRRQAVRELAQRSGGQMPTPGQITGDAGKLETAARTTNPAMFQKAEDTFVEATEKAREELIRPVGQGTRQEFGRGVLKTLDDVEKAVKTRTGQIFDKAQGVEGRVNMQGVLDAIDNTLATDLRSAQRLLSPAERADLEKLRNLMMPDEFAPEVSTVVSASGKPFPMGDMEVPQASMALKDAMNFISGNKARLRSVNPDGKAGNTYSALISRINKETDDAALATIEKASPALRGELKGARADYREMMENVYDDAGKAALKALPEDILRKFTQTGNVSEIQQYQTMLRIAQREGKIGSEEVTKANQRLARGFLDGVAKDSDALAKWSAKLRADTPLRETWNAITEAPGGAEIKAAMGVLEQMAQVARSEGMTTGGQFIPLTRAQHGGLGVSLVTGTIRPGLILTGVGLTGATKALATMYTQAEKGMLNHMMRALRATQAGTPAAIEGAKASFQAISKWAEENGQEDPFTYEQSTEGK